MKVTAKAKRQAKRVVILAQCPTPKNIAKLDAERPQYSIKCKKRLAKYAAKHKLTPKEVEIATHGQVSVSQARAWDRDLLDGRYSLKNSVSVSRS